MGDRGADPRSEPTAEELERMAALVAEGVAAGAVGVSTSRTEVHRTSKGDNLGTLRAGVKEILALAGALRDVGAGVFQLVSDSYRTTDDDFAASELDLIEQIARTSGRPVSFTVLQSTDAPERWRDLMAKAEGLTAAGWDVKAQVAPRPTGMLLGLPMTVHPFSYCRPYLRIADLPLAERVSAMRDPERKAKILSSHATLTSGEGAFAGLAFLGRFDDMYVLDDPVDYDLHSDRSLGAAARTAGLDPGDLVYETLLGRGGTQLVYAPFFNFAHGNLQAVREMITSPVAMFGLSDAGAHCGFICDASMTTSYLSVWARDRDDRIPVEQVVHQITQRPAAHVGWLDRGVIAPGYLADLNILDFDDLSCLPPEIVHDLPAGGRRLIQRSTGYLATIKGGTVTFEHGQQTGERPGRLVRGTRPAPRW
jgi:N-acyl-D-aspartate/D-glutamate deacylase